MISRSRLVFRKVAVIGIGLIGGSMAMAIKEHRLARQVVGVSRRQVTLNFALRNKIVDRGTSDLKRAVENADLVVLALPVRSIIHVMSIIPRHLKRGCIVTDVGSIKSNIQDAANKHLPPSVSFVGGHPMAGSEKSGIAHADAKLFQDSLCILTPNDRTPKAAVEKVRQLWSTFGAKVQTMSVSEHDENVAYISHGPHVIAYGLVQSVPDKAMKMAAGGFKDTTRIAASDPKLWCDVCFENSKNIIKSLDQLVAVLADYRRAIIARDEKKILDYFSKAKEKREGMDNAGSS